MYVKFKHVSSRNLLEYRAKLLNFNITSWWIKDMFILEMKKKMYCKTFVMTIFPFNKTRD